jgi:hypothetical protein
VQDGGPGGVRAVCAVRGPGTTQHQGEGLLGVYAAVAGGQLGHAATQTHSAATVQPNRHSLDTGPCASPPVMRGQRLPARHHATVPKVLSIAP